MKTSDIEDKFWDAFFSGEYDPELYAEYFGLQNSDKETAKETATQTQTKTVTRGIYNRVPAGNGQFRHDKVGETVANYIFEVVDAATLRFCGAIQPRAVFTMVQQAFQFHTNKITQEYESNI